MTKIRSVVFVVGICVLVFLSQSSYGKSLYGTFDEYYSYTVGQVNDKANPCEDFVGYACSRISQDDDVNKVFCPVGNELFEILLRGEPMMASGNVKKIVDAYTECKKSVNLSAMFEQVDYLKAIGQWPVKRNYTWTDVARLNAELNSYLQPSLVGFTLYPASAEGTMFVLDLFSTTAPLEAITQSMMEIGGADRDEALAAAAKVVEFYRTYLVIHDAITIAPEHNFLVNKDTLAKMIPEYDWEEHFRVMNLNLENSLDRIKKRPFDVRRMRMAAILINKTDPNTVVDYLVYKHVEFLNMGQCGCEMGYYRPFLLNRLWNRNISPKDEINHLKLLDQFETSMNTFALSFPNSTTRLTQENVDKLRNVMSKRHEFLSENVVDNFYRSTIVRHNFMYGNNVNMMHKAVTGFLAFYNDKVKLHSLTAIENFLVGEYDRTVDMKALGKPMIHLYASQNLRFWDQFIWENAPFDNLYLAKSCVGKSHVIRNYDFLGDYAAVKLNYINYMDYVKESNILKSRTMHDMKKLFFVSLVQDKFRKRDSAKLHSLVRVFRYMEEFSETFNCTDGSSMKVERANCVLEQCVTSLGGSSLLPFNTPGCV